MEQLLALHGFAGTGRIWDPVADALGAGWEVAAPDLPGHGGAAGEAVSLQSCVRVALDAAAPRFVLAGYSMGGRIALHVALAAPERVAALVLVSTSAGIDDPGERARRRAADEALAASTEGASIDAFAERWMELELFAGEPPAARERWRADILRNDPAGLAASLRAVGTGALEPLWGRLGEIDVPASVVVGERDARYRALGERLVSALPFARAVVVPAAGHGLPREAPRPVAEAIAAAAPSR